MPVGAIGQEAEELAGLEVILTLSQKKKLAAKPSKKTIQASLLIQP